MNAQLQPTPLIRIHGLRRTYQMGDTSINALRGVDVDIYANEYVAIMGPSGSGKTTLMNMIGCLDSPDDGSRRVLFQTRYAF